MAEQQLNLLFVREVEKRPVLYNFRLPEYSMKRETEKAWTEIGKIVNLSASDCREKWKNIRAVFVRHLKNPKTPSKKGKKAYYLSDALRFAVPYIKALGISEENISDFIQLKEEGHPNDAESFADDIESQAPPHFLLEQPNFLPSQQFSTFSADNVDDCQLNNSRSSAESSPQRDPLSTSNLKKKRCTTNDAEEKVLLQYLNSKNTSSTKEDWNPKDPKTEAMKMFLLSLLPDLQKMTDHEVRQFKRRTLDVVDDILSARCMQTQPGPVKPEATET